MMMQRRPGKQIYEATKEDEDFIVARRTSVKWKSIYFLSSDYKAPTGLFGEVLIVAQEAYTRRGFEVLLNGIHTEESTCNKV